MMHEFFMMTVESVITAWTDCCRLFQKRVKVLFRNCNYLKIGRYQDNKKVNILKQLNTKDDENNIE